MGVRHTELSSLALYSVQGSRPFLVGIDGECGDERLTIHAAHSCTTSNYTRRIRARLETKDLAATYKVKRHRSHALERSRSLAEFLRPFHHDRIVCDPTGAFERALKLVKFASQLRKKLGRCVISLLWQGERHTVHVVLKWAEFLDGKQLDLAKLANIESTVRSTLLEACGPHASNHIRTVRFGFEFPKAATVPIDKKSYASGNKFSISSCRRFATRALATLLSLGVVSTAGAEEAGKTSKATATKTELGLTGKVGRRLNNLEAGGVVKVPLGESVSTAPAVSGPNMEFGLLGGIRDDETTFIAEGALTLPLGHRFGARIDGTAGVSNDEFIGGSALHLFWRDPGRGLLGVAGGYATVDPKGGINESEDFGRIAAEGEVYFDRFTISGFAGGQFSDGEVEEGFAGRLDLEWYLTDNFLFSTGAEWNPEREGLGRVGVEYMPGLAGLPGLSFVAEGAFGDDDYTRVYGGIRLYFGKSKTLKDRHRYDTFRSHLFSTTMTDTPKDNTTPTATAAGYGG